MTAQTILQRYDSIKMEFIFKIALKYYESRSIEDLHLFAYYFEYNYKSVVQIECFDYLLEFGRIE